MDSLTPSRKLMRASEILDSFLLELGLEEGLERARLVMRLLSEMTAEELSQPLAAAENKLVAWVADICGVDSLHGTAAVESAKAGVLLAGAAGKWPTSFLADAREVTAACREAVILALPVAAPAPLPVAMPDQSLVPVGAEWLGQGMARARRRSVESLAQTRSISGR